MADEIKKERKSRLLRGAKFQMKAPCPTAKGKWSSCYWDLWGDNPRFCVRTNDPADSGNSFGTITAAMEMPTFFVLMDMIDKAAESTEPVKIKLDCFTQLRGDGGKPGEIVLAHEIHVGKDAQNRVYISAIDKQQQRPVIQFFFAPPDNRFHKFYINGIEVDDSNRTCYYAKGIAAQLRKLIPQIAIADYTPPPPRDQNGGGWKGNSGGGGWKNKQSGGGYNKPSGGYSEKPATSAIAEDGDEGIPW